MSESQIGDNNLLVTVSLEIDASLSAVLNPVEPLSRAVREGMSHGLAELLGTLGIPGTPSVQIRDLKKETIHTDQFMSVSVNGQLCRYSDELLQRVHSYVNNIPLDPQTNPTSTLEWLRGLSENVPESDDSHRRLVDFLTLSCLEIITQQPAVLLGLLQTQTYAATLPDPSDALNPLQLQREWPPDPAWLHPILRETLNLRISIADKPTVARVLALHEQGSQEDVAEHLIAALRPDVVDIEVPLAYLKHITTSDSELERGIFASLREELFTESGLTYPTFRFVPNERLRPNSFAFKINHLTTLPWTGMQQDRCLVQETHSTLRLLDIQDSIPARIPSTRFEGSVIDAYYQPVVEAVGFATWSLIQYFVLCFASDLRQFEHCFVHRLSVQEQLDRLSYTFPTLLESIRSKMSVEQVARVFRSLAAEGVAIRDMKLVLERLVDYKYLGTGRIAQIMLDDPLPVFDDYVTIAQGNEPSLLVAFTRVGLGRQICHKYTRDTNILPVYILDSEAEQLISSNRHSESGEARDQNLIEDLHNELLRTIRAEVAHLPPSLTGMPVILASTKIRLSLREIIAPEFPQLPVLAHSEIPADINIEILSKITLNA